ncbi:hypothetical protein LUZ60_002926 [Juncus effusus]|nr:hypothetical protein LUZ60_002926 [Juncus effusus]
MENSLPTSFNVHRFEPKLVVPAIPTPHELKPLSDIDDQQGFRFYSSGIHLYKNNPSKLGQDPVKVIEEALSKALVYYYPLAGRLREEAGKKLVLDCTGEGVVLVEAEADLTADDFGVVQGPPFPCFDQFIYDPDNGSEIIIDRPLLYIQVTRLKCGGFVFGQRFCHSSVDAPGGMQFEIAIGELARGASTPSINPVWSRELFYARKPPRVTHSHPEFVDPVGNPITSDPIFTTARSDTIEARFFFSSKEMSALKKHLPPCLSVYASRFELITACIWRSRAVALGYAPNDEVRVAFIVNARGKSSIPIPKGFYGNAFAYFVASSDVETLCNNTLDYAVELIKKAKSGMTYEHLQSLADMLVMRGRPFFNITRTYIVSDISYAGFKEVDFGWGEPIYAGPAKGGEGPIKGVASYYSRGKNEKGQEATVVPVCLPVWAMERFRSEIEKLTTEPSLDFGEVI